MKKVVSDWSTDVILHGREPEDICKLGQGSECCAFLTVGSDGFVCVRMNTSFSANIFDRLKAGTMNAKGEGGWAGCAWEEKPDD